MDWEWLAEARKWIGGLSPFQKISGYPGSSDDAWSRKTNDTNQVIKLDDGSTHYVSDRKIITTWLGGIYNRTNGTIDVDALSNLCTYLRYLIDSYYANRNESDVSLHETKTVNNATSAAEYTHTVPAGHAHKITFAAMSNATRAPNPYLDINAGAAHSLIANTNNGTQSNVCPVIGGRPSDDLNVLDAPLWLQPGDTITIGDGNFVAADGMTWIICYEDYTL